VIIEELNHAPYGDNMRTDGLLDIIDAVHGATSKPGLVLGLWLQLRKRVGVVEAVQKKGMKFKTRSAEDLIDAVRPVANELGLLIYPTECKGSGFPVEDGTLAAVNLDIIVQAVEDGSAIKIAGFGLGADSQDKAGGKAGTYGFKQALLQGLLAAGADDTDDTDTPIKGGVRAPIRPQVHVQIPTVSKSEVVKALESANTLAEYDTAKKLLGTLSPEIITQLYSTAKAAKARCEENAKTMDKG
jgi:hypothetical protein